MLRWLLAGLFAFAAAAPGAVLAAPASQADVAAEARQALVKISYQITFRDRNGIVRSDEILGSGFIFDPSGLIYTNHHVIEDSDGNVVVTLPDGSTTPGVVVGADFQTDIAVVRIGGGPYPVVRLGDSSAVRVGNVVTAIGHTPLVSGDPTRGRSGTVTRLDGTMVFVTNGTEHKSLIVANVPVFPGDSGGPLLNANGEVVGMTVIGLYSISGNRLVVSQTMFIPVNRVKSIGAQLVQGGRVVRPYLGIGLTTNEPGIAATYGSPPGAGVLITGIDPDGPVYAAGIRSYDLLQSLDGVAVPNVDAALAVIDAFVPGQQVVFAGIRRNGVPFSVTVTVAERQD